MKSYARTIILKNNAGLIAEYMHHHDEIWPEVIPAYRKIGILNRRIWMIGRQLFIVIDTIDTFDPEKDMKNLHPKAKEWEAMLETYQESIGDEDSWSQMELIFSMNEE